MKVDPRFRLDIDGMDGQVKIRVIAAAECLLAGDETRLVEADFSVLAGMAGADGDWAQAVAEPALRRLVVNGWQSWSWAGELADGEVVHPSLVKRFSMFSQGPVRWNPRTEAISYFYVGAACDEEESSGGATRYVYMVSRNAGTAPLAFRASRKDGSLEVLAVAGGHRCRVGEVVAELRLFACRGEAAAKERFRGIFADEGHFERLRFLGSGGRLVPGGYESWYNHYTDISESLMDADLEGLAEPGNLISGYYVGRGKPTVFQIDDGWELRVGEWFADLDKFPSGMKAMSSRIEAKGYIPGLWLAPFLVTKRCSVCRDHPDWILEDDAGRRVLAGWNPNWDGDFWCLDLSLPEVEDYLVATFERVVEEWGFRYLKLDFLYAAFLPGKRRNGGAAFEHWERVIGRITSRHKDRAGKPVAWLGCGAPLESSWRHFPLMRIGADTREAWEYGVLKLLRHEGRPSAYANMLATIGRSVLDGTVFVNDPDVVFCREANNKLDATEKELVALVDFLLASQIMYSDGAADVRAPSVQAFTARIIEAFDRLEGRHFTACRLARDVFQVDSTDSSVRGLVNLSGKPFVTPAAAWRGQAVVAHAEARGADLAFGPHSISLYLERK